MNPQIKRPHDPMALAKLVGDIATGQVVDGREISTREALDALARHTQAREEWMLKASALMQCINAPGIEHARLREMCEAHIFAKPKL